MDTWHGWVESCSPIVSFGSVHEPELLVFAWRLSCAAAYWLIYAFIDEVSAVVGNGETNGGNPLANLARSERFQGRRTTGD